MFIWRYWFHLGRFDHKSCEYIIAHSYNIVKVMNGGLEWIDPNAFVYLLWKLGLFFCTIKCNLSSEELWILYLIYWRCIFMLCACKCLTPYDKY